MNDQIPVDELLRWLASAEATEAFHQRKAQYARDQRAEYERRVLWHEVAVSQAAREVMALRERLARREQQNATA